VDFTEARDSEWQWHQLGHMQVCTSLQTDNHASTPPLSFLQDRCPSCRPTNSVKAQKTMALKASFRTTPSISTSNRFNKISICMDAQTHAQMDRQTNKEAAADRSRWRKLIKDV